VTLDGILRFAGFGTEIVLVLLILTRRLYKQFPVFCAYLVWDLLDNLILYAIASRSPANYFQIFITALAVDSVFEFAVLVELAWSVLRPFRSALPRGAIVIVALLVVGVGAAVWPFSYSVAYGHYGPQSRLFLHMYQTIAIMRILFFLVLAGCSQLLAINRRDRELQIATGLGFFSLVSVAVSIIHSGQAAGPLYHHLDQVVEACNVGCLLYWFYSFARKAVPRREFTPQMQSLLLAVAGNARSTRIALADAQSQESHRKDGR
jgi:hypothetical protein